VSRFFYCIKERDSNKEGADFVCGRKPVRWTVFADVGNEQSEAKGTAVPGKIPIPLPNTINPNSLAIVGEAFGFIFSLP
jgi:hypothetical protein